MTGYIKLILPFISLFFLACESENQAERISELEEEIEELEEEASDTEEDFYFAYNALEQIGQQDTGNIDSLRNIARTTVENLGEKRFYRGKDNDNDFAFDVLTLRYIELNPQMLKFSRELRFRDYENQRKAIIEAMATELGN